MSAVVREVRRGIGGGSGRKSNRGKGARAQQISPKGWENAGCDARDSKFIKLGLP